MIEWIISIIFVLFILYRIFLRPNVYTFGSNYPHLLIIGGTHGDEPAPFHYLNQLKTDLKKTNINGKITIIPNVNKLGLWFQTRTLFSKDINREYFVVNDLIMNYVKTADIIIDMHEGVGFHRINSKTIGSTIFGNNIPADLASQIIYNLDKTVDYPHHRWSHINVQDKPGTLSTKTKNKLYIVVETTKLHPLSTRTKHLEIVVNTIRNYYKI